MAFKDDPRVAAARLRTMSEVVDRLLLSGLRRASGELTGPCPVCGGRDRFSINVKKGAYNCRQCGGGDHIALVAHVMGLDFIGAVEWLEGSGGEVSEAELERRLEAQHKAKEKEAAAAARYRAWARRDAVQIWQRARSFWGTPAEAYLAGRGLRLAGRGYRFACFRFLPAHPYVKKIGGRLVTCHTGAALIAAVQDAGGTLSAVHQTWIDPARPGQKAEIVDPDTGAALASKMLRGSKKGGAIRLSGNACTSSLVMGEGIETTLTALCADAAPGASYWAGVDFGNMSGRQTGRNTGLPDLSDLEAFVPPDHVDRLVFIEDGDSDKATTRAKMLSGIRRAMARNPGLRGHIVRAGEGVDLNDLI